MDAIYNLLQAHRLEAYYLKFVELGVKDERDFLDGVTDEDLNNIGLSHVDRNHFSALKDKVRRLRAPASPAGISVKKLTEPFSLQFMYPKCPGPKYITDMDPEQNTLEDLMLRICFLEGFDSSMGVCLYAIDGMPLTDDPFFNTWSLSDRHIKSGDVIYAMFTPKKNLWTAPHFPADSVDDAPKPDKVRCHVMLRGAFDVTVDLKSDTVGDLKKKLVKETGIPRHVLHYRGEHGMSDILESCGISEESTVYFSLSSFSEEPQDFSVFFNDDVAPSVQQTTKGISVFWALLYIVKHRALGVSAKKLISIIRKLTGCHPLAQSLYQLFIKNEAVSRNQKIAVVEGLYLLFRELLPQPGKKQGDRIIDDVDVFEYSAFCWAHLLSEAKKETQEHENYAPFSLTTEDTRFLDPVTIPGVPGTFEKAHVLKKIKDGQKIPNCTEENLRETSLRKDTKTEKILLSVHPSIVTYHLWISHDSVTCQNFAITSGKSLGDMAEEMKAFPCLKPTPPLLLKNLGCDDICLVHLSNENLGVYLQKDKMKPAEIHVYDFLSGKHQMMDVDLLAAQTGDCRVDDSIPTTRTPKEAVLVLIDTSSSMKDNGYGSLEMRKIDAVKQLFENFATRTMAYDFHHVMGLVTFSSSVKTVHTFTETLEKFKEHVHTLEPEGSTKLYDALQQGVVEMEKLKKFPDCKLRILCLTDGEDVGSSNKPEVVTANLIRSNIIVDSILLGESTNSAYQALRLLANPGTNQGINIMRGISNATGGCSFKPETSKDGLKLFERETVLSLEMRKPKRKADPSSVTANFLMALSTTCGYDTLPEVVLPSQMTSKVTETQSALKKTKGSRGVTLMEKDKRILEELRSLHCNPHPYFSIFPSESDFTFWKIVMEGPPETPYESGVFELFCEFGKEYPVKPPTVRFVTPIYHCNINNVGRICHNIFDRNYNAQITMRNILDAVYGLLIIPEPEDPLDSILAEEFLTDSAKYEEEAKKHTAEKAATSRDEVEKKLVEPQTQMVPRHLICPLTKKMFVDPVMTRHGRIYERKAIEKHLKKSNHDPVGGPEEPLTNGDLRPAHDMKSMVSAHRSRQIQ